MNIFIAAQEISKTDDVTTKSQPKLRLSAVLALFIVE